MKGVQFLTNEDGEKLAVQIDLQAHGELWEDFYDALLVRERAGEPTESLEEVEERILGK